MAQFSRIKISKKPIYLKLAEDINFFELFRKIEQEFDTCFILESLGEQSAFSRYSIIGFDPQQIISAKENAIKVNKTSFTVKNPYFALRKIMPPQPIARNYAGGLIGYLSYEAINYIEPSVNVKIHPLFDQFMFGVYIDGLIHDKLTNELFYFFYDGDRSRIFKKIMNTKLRKNRLDVKFIKDGLTKREHSEIVEKVKDQIKAGNTFQCEVGFKSEYKIQGNSLEIYRRLRHVNPSPFMYYLKFGNKKIIGASPELLFSLRD